MKRVLLLALAACGHDAAPAPTPAVATPSPPTPESPTPAGYDCTSLPFEATTPVPEASGIAWLTVDGKPVLVTMGDSDRDGAYGLLDPDTGKTFETGKLPLGDASDDLEGLATRDGVLYGLTSAGWMRAWKRTAGSPGGFELVDGPYPLGPVDLPDRRSHDRPPAGDGMVCSAHGMNCGRNYEGLCLPAHPGGGCTGFVASKADGHLYCLADDPDHAGRFVVRRQPALEIGKPGTLADCAFAADVDDLYVASNMFDQNHVYRVSGWRDLASATLTPLGSLGLGFEEGVAVRGDVVYRFSDLGGAPSLIAKFRCTPTPR